jgi:mycothiol synthase
MKGYREATYGRTMDPSNYSIRPFRETDYEAVARVNASIGSQFPETAEESRRWHELIVQAPARFEARFVVEQVPSGTVVAWAGITHTVWNYHPRKLAVRVVVDPDHRRRGIGGELYARLEMQARGHDAIALWAGARENDPSGVHFLQRRDFVTLRKSWLSRLDLRGVDPSRLPDRSKALGEQGLRFTTFDVESADRPGARRELHELSRVTAADAPRVGEYSPPTFEEFARTDLDPPKALSDAIFLACHGARFVGWSTLQRLDEKPDTLDIGFTGTLPEYRGRGIASELKRRAVEYARAHGYRYVITGNDSLNPRIWAINEKLGFRRQEVLLQAEKQLPSPSS